jgi:hypothetical protein
VPHQKIRYRGVASESLKGSDVSETEDIGDGRVQVLVAGLERRDSLSDLHAFPGKFIHQSTA